MSSLLLLHQWDQQIALLAPQGYIVCQNINNKNNSNNNNYSNNISQSSHDRYDLDFNLPLERHDLQASQYMNRRYLFQS